MRKKKADIQKENQDKLVKSINNLDIIVKTDNIPKNIRNKLKEIIVLLNDEKVGSISVRAANAVSMMESMTQNHQVQSHIRTMIWQAISSLESIRE